jgi:hypothetical protein
MRERAELLGGTIEFLRPEPCGTLVRLRIPKEFTKQILTKEKLPKEESLPESAPGEGIQSEERHV